MNAGRIIVAAIAAGIIGFHFGDIWLSVGIYLALALICSSRRAS